VVHKFEVHHSGGICGPKGHTGGEKDPLGTFGGNPRGGGVPKRGGALFREDLVAPTRLVGHQVSPRNRMGGNPRGGHHRVERRERKPIV